MISFKLFDNKLFEQYIQKNYGGQPDYKISVKYNDIIDYFKPENEAEYAVIEYFGNAENIEKEFSLIKCKALKKSMIHVFVSPATALKELNNVLKTMDNVDICLSPGLYIYTDIDEELIDKNYKIRVLSLRGSYNDWLS